MVKGKRLRKPKETVKPKHWHWVKAMQTDLNFEMQKPKVKDFWKRLHLDLKMPKVKEILKPMHWARHLHWLMHLVILVVKIPPPEQTYQKFEYRLHHEQQ